jgi:hypothetical protein
VHYGGTGYTARWWRHGYVAMAAWLAVMVLGGSSAATWLGGGGGVVSGGGGGGVFCKVAAWVGK